jgi:hypothetical protein
MKIKRCEPNWRFDFFLGVIFLVATLSYWRFAGDDPGGIIVLAACVISGFVFTLFSWEYSRLKTVIDLEAGENVMKERGPSRIGKVLGFVIAFAGLVLLLLARSFANSGDFKSAILLASCGLCLTISSLYYLREYHWDYLALIRKAGRR